jgi:hypothetical protein
LTTNFSAFDPGTLKKRLRDGHTEPGGIPWRSASARMNGFIAEPGWR